MSMKEKESFANRLNEAMRIRNFKQVDLVERTGLTKSAISQYVSGIYEPKQKALYLLAKALNVNEAWLMGYDVSMERHIEKYPANILKIEKRKLPLLKEVDNSSLVFAEEKLEFYVEAGTRIDADFCIKVKDDSMINARINNGDIVFIRQRSFINDGEIAAVIINNEAVLKRIYKKKDEIILLTENPAYPPIVYKNHDEIRFLGKVVAFQSEVA